MQPPLYRSTPSKSTKRKYNYYLVCGDFDKWYFSLFPFGSPNNVITNYLKQFEDWWHYLPDTYIFKTRYTSKQIADDFITRFPEVNFLVIKVDVRDFNGFLRKDAFKWLAKQANIKGMKFVKQTKM